MAEKESKWIKFYPSLELPKERVSIAYDTHDERGYRFAYGYFQFYNGTCGCFWKDGNEQPKVVKTEDIKYWMPIPSLDVQEESKECMYSKDDFNDEDRKILCDGCEEDCKYNKKDTVSEDLEKIVEEIAEPTILSAYGTKELARRLRNTICGTSVSENLEEAIDSYLATYFGGEKEKQNWPFLKKMAIHFAKWQKEHLWKSADGDDLPEYEREVVVFTQIFPDDAEMMRVAIGHRPNPEGWDGKSLSTGKVEHYTPKTYDKCGWNIPNVKYWLDCSIPKEIEL